MCIFFWSKESLREKFVFNKNSQNITFYSLVSSILKAGSALCPYRTIYHKIPKISPSMHKHLQI